MNTLKRSINFNRHRMALQQDNQLRLNKVKTSFNVLQTLQNEEAKLTNQLNDEMQQYNKILLKFPNEIIAENEKIKFYSKKRRETALLSAFISKQLLLELNDYLITLS